MYKNCTGVIETNIERVCFNVNELVCNLVEAVHYETLEETYQVQRCFTGKDRVCDTTYDIDTTTKDDYQCCNVETPNCYMEEKRLVPRKLRSTATPRTARSSPGRSATSARRSPFSRCATGKRGSHASTSPGSSARMKISSTATRWRRLSWKKFAT